METATLRSFATKARTELIKEVGARVSVVLAENSLARVESLSAVRRLEQAIVSDGRDEVVDRIAYTWFNRIIALRFMDANGYTPSAIVSPEAGRTIGQPEVLAEAKAGTFDNAVVPAKTQAMITALFNRTRPSQDPDGEAYGLLLEAYCRSWHRAMPFMFEREGDYTELLIPAALLAVDSVRDRAVKTLTEDVCRDVEVIGWLYQFYISERKDEVFDGFKKNKKAGAAEIPAATQLFTPHWVVRYLVENSLGRLWLLNNPSSRLAEHMDYYVEPMVKETDFLKIARPEELKILDPAVGSGHMLTYAFDLLDAIYTEKGYDPVEIPGLILQHNLYGTEIDPRAGALAAFALTMKAAAKRKLFLKNAVQPGIRVLGNIHFSADELDYLWSLVVGEGSVRRDADEFWNAYEHADTIGSLIQPKENLIAPMRAAIEGATVDGDILRANTLQKATKVIEQTGYLSQRYSIVVANPPYMGSGNMSDRLSTFAKLHFPTAKADLMTMFMVRAPSLVKQGGSWAMINLPSWMFLSTFRELRADLLQRGVIVSMVHPGRGVFGADFGSVAFVVDCVTPSPSSTGIYRRLFTKQSEVRTNERLQELFRDASYQRFIAKQDTFSLIPGSPIAYWLSQPTVAPFLAPSGGLDKFALNRGKNVTGNNARFARFHWEVSRSDVGAFDKRWLPCAFGGPRRKWFGNLVNVIDWSESARRHYKTAASSSMVDERYWKQPGVTWSKIGIGRPSFRYLRPNEMYQEVAITQSTAEDSQLVLGILNSSVSEHYLSFLSPTVNFQREDIVAIPLAEVESSRATVQPLVSAALEIATSDWDSQEISLGYRSDRLAGAAERGAIRTVVAHLLAESDAQTAGLVSIETRLNEVIASSFGLEGELKIEVEASEVTLWGNLANRYPNAHRADAERRFARDAVADLASYAVGCMFGRYSLDAPGLILADQGATLQDYYAKVSTPSFVPDADNVIPIVDGEWFEDDVVARFRQFLRVRFGVDHLEENLRFITESLGVSDIRDYFVKSFYDDHVRRYKKRPIYWLFRSPKGSFSALVYLHRYNTSTASTVLTGYLREFIGKLEANLEHQERVASGMGGASTRDVASALKEADRIRKVLVELRDYEHDVLFPLAGEQIVLDLDDGVLVNYQKLGAALKDIGLKKGGGGE